MEAECWLTWPLSFPHGGDQTQHFEALGIEKKSCLLLYSAIDLVELVAVQACHT